MTWGALKVRLRGALRKLSPFLSLQTRSADLCCPLLRLARPLLPRWRRQVSRLSVGL